MKESEEGLTSTIVIPNREVKTEFQDIVLTSFHPERYPNLIIEFKQGESVEELAQVAINQIKEKQYATNMKGKTILMGVAHNKKKCEIKTEEYITI